MKTMFTGSAGNLISSRPITAFGVAGKLTRQTVTRPTLAVMSETAARSFRVPGLKIVHAFSADSPRGFPDAVLYAHGLSRSGQINITVRGPFAVQTKDGEPLLGLNTLLTATEGLRTGAGYHAHKMSSKRSRTIVHKRKFGSRILGTAKTHSVQIQPSRLPNIEIELESDPDGTPVIVIITPKSTPPTYRVKHVCRGAGKKNTTDDNNQNTGKEEPPTPLKYLKPPYDDGLIISALQAADKELLNESHLKKLKYRDGRGYNVKQFNDIHLLVCLFFYIYVNKLYASSDFYFGLRGHFHEFCAKNVSNGINLGSKSYFTRCINRLENARYSFEEYIKADKKPDIKMEKGDFNFVFWHEIYIKALILFEQTIKPPIFK